MFTCECLCELKKVGTGNTDPITRVAGPGLDESDPGKKPDPTVREKMGQDPIVKKNNRIRPKKITLIIFEMFLFYCSFCLNILNTIYRL